MHTRRVWIERGQFFIRLLSFIEASQSYEAANKIRSGASVIWTEAHCFERLFQGLVVFAKKHIVESQIVMRNEIVRVHARPRLLDLDNFIHLAGAIIEVFLRNIESFSFAYPVAKVVSLLDILFRRLDLLLVTIKYRYSGVGH